MSRRAALALFLLALVASPAAAHAEYEIDPNGAAIELLDSAGEPELRAGAHPDRMVTRFAFEKNSSGEFEANAKDLNLDLPPGMSGDPRATPTCPRFLFAEESCPADTQVGVARPTFGGLGTFEQAIYNVEPEPGELGEVGFSALILSVRFAIELRPGDYGIRLEALDLPQEVPLVKGEIELWGVPADHQPETSIPRRAFLTAPTSCDAAASVAELRLHTWQRPNEWRTTPLSLPPFVGCEELAFSPSLQVTPSTGMADTPTGLRVILGLPQNEDPDGRATSQARSTAVTLPPGFSLSPAVAQGLSACTDEQIAIGEAAPATCPRAAKLGTVEIASPATTVPIQGDIYLGQSAPSMPFRIFIVAGGPGLRIKLAGLLRADPGSGRLEMALSELPALPVSRFELSFRDGPRAPLASPPTCTTGSARAQLGPYDGAPDAIVTTSVATTEGANGSSCRRGEPFAPTFVAGSSSAVAGGDVAFSTTLRRRDGEQAIESLQMTLPPGLVANLGGVERCSEARVAAATCPTGSRVGSTFVEAGAGPAPLPLRGDVFLTGPYRGAPFGLAIVLRVSIGLLDLGNVTIRATLANDPGTVRLTMSTDPLPPIVAGVPLRLRTVGIDVDRRGFIRNPTSCRPARIDATVISVDGATAWPFSPFGVGRCGKLGVDPNLSLALLGARSKRPGLQIRIRPSKRGANLRSVAVKLPKLLKLDSSGSKPCSRDQFKRDRCPAASRVGSARATTPLLPGQLSGPVRLVRASDIGAPEIWTSLQGGGMRLTTRSTIAVTADGQVLNTLEDLPDVPLGTLTTSLRGGKGSFLAAERAPCAAKSTALLADATVRAQSGAQISRLLRVGLHPACRHGRRAVR